MEVPRIFLSRETYYDKVYGCWLGKNAGGTLGAPFERLFGQEELFKVSWYPQLQPGGIPNDDLEIQLVWLQALKDRGLHITAKDLADYWLRCIWYNPDEYGLHKTNLRLGLTPPVSGWYNNWFKNCMGSPIRSEIWACIAPGSPKLAAQYAYQDAICDHAGGESVYGEIFNAVIESAAFFISDIPQLLEIGLATIPPTSETAKAIQTAIQAKKEGIDWITARNRVKTTVYHPIAQYSPINLGYQTIGLLYGKDFGEVICTAVKCGWDTDCTGATAGALWGIIHGKSHLPPKWIDPLGDSLRINEKCILNIDVPRNLDDLTRQTCALGEQVIKEFNSPVQISDQDLMIGLLPLIQEQISAIPSIYSTPPNLIPFDISSFHFEIVYPQKLQGPTIIPNAPLTILVRIHNTSLVIKEVQFEIKGPLNWKLEHSSLKDCKILHNSTLEILLTVIAPNGSISLSNQITVRLSPTGEPSIEIPIVVIGANAWLLSSIYPLKTLKHRLPPENDRRRKNWGSEAIWKPIWFPDNELLVEALFQGNPGIIYLRHYLYSPTSKKVIIGVPNSNRMQIWLNGRFIHATRRIVPLRPNYGGDGSNYCHQNLKAGWNHVLIKLERGLSPIHAHFTIADHHLAAGLTELRRNQYPWD